MPSNTVIEYHPLAQEDLEEIIHYIAQSDQVSALTILTVFDETIKKLQANPLLGDFPNNRMEKLGWRQLNVNSYFFIYKIRENTIEIRAIVHGWITWEKAKAKLHRISTKPHISHEILFERIKTKIEYKKREKNP